MKCDRGVRGNLNPEGCEALGNAVILRAARDYVNVLRRLMKNKDNAMAQAQAKELRRFFKSQEFTVFSKLDGELLLARIDQEFYESNGKYSFKQVYRVVADEQSKDL